MGQQHATAAVSLHVEIIEDPLGILSRFPSPFELFIRRGNNFPARETPNWYHNGPISYFVLAGQR